jgi:hypothetical protein
MQMAHAEAQDPTVPASPRKGRRSRTRLVLLAGLPLGLALQHLLGRDPALIESLYSRGLYPQLSGLLACLVAWVPFSVAEASLLVLAAYAAYRLVDALRRRGQRLRALGTLALDAAAAGSAAYFAFVVLWGLNYGRVSFADNAGLDVSPAAVAELEAVSAALVDEANLLREGLPEDYRGRLALPDGRHGALSRVAAGYAALSEDLPFTAVGCVRARPALLSELLSHLGIAGIFVPLTAEPHVNTTVPPGHLPFFAAHEVAHLAGFAREDEANYLGYLACRRHPDRDYRYSGTLGASIYALGALSRVAPEAARRLAAARSPGVQRDVEAIREWWQRYEGRMSRTSRRVNDAYLKSQGQREGVASYGRMVDLLIAERRDTSG